jgi:hypothetical protein
LRGTPVVERDALCRLLDGRGSGGACKRRRDQTIWNLDRHLEVGVSVAGVSAFIKALIGTGEIDSTEIAASCDSELGMMLVVISSQIHTVLRIPICSKALRARRSMYWLRS